MDETQERGGGEGLRKRNRLGFPEIGREERVQLAQRLEEGAKCDWDYLTMMTLAAVLASLGRLQDSTVGVPGVVGSPGAVRSSSRHVPCPPPGEPPAER